MDETERMKEWREVEERRTAVLAETVEVLKGTRDVAAKSDAEVAEAWRQQRHHDVLCLVLKACIEGRMRIKAAGIQIPDALPGDIVAEAHAIANLAYPPPEKP